MSSPISRSVSSFVGLGPTKETATIYLGLPLPDSLMRPTRDVTSEEVRRPSSSLHGLAPSGVYQPNRSPGPLVVSYTTVSPLPCLAALAVYFLLHFPSAHAAWELPSTLALRSPDFPPGLLPAVAQRTRLYDTPDQPSTSSVPLWYDDQANQKVSRCGTRSS